MASMGSMSAGTMPQFFQQLGTGAEQASTKTQTFTERMSGFQGNLLTAATSVGTFTASIFGIDAAMDGLTQSELSLEQARVRQDRMQTTLQAQEQRLNDLRTSGTATAAEIAVQEERVNTTRQQVEVQTERVAFQQQNLSEQYAQFGAQILPQVITASLSGVTAFQSIFTLVGKNEKAVAALNKAWSGLSNAFRTVDAAQYTGALTSAAGSTSAFGTVVSTIVPLLAGAAAGFAAVAVPVLLWAKNIGGARDIMSEVGVAIGNLHPHLKLMMGQLEYSARLWTNWTEKLDLTGTSLTTMSASMKKAQGDIGAAIGDIADRIQTLTVNIEELSMVGKGGASGYPLFESMFGSASEIQKIVAQADIMIGMIDNIGSVINKKGGIIDAASIEKARIDFLAFSKEFNINLTEMGITGTEVFGLVDTQFKMMASRITELNAHPPLDIFQREDTAKKLEMTKAIIENGLGNIKGLLITHGADIQKILTEAWKAATDPIGFSLDQLIAKIRQFGAEDFNLGAALAIDPSIIGLIDNSASSLLKMYNASKTTDDELLTAARITFPSWKKGLEDADKTTYTSEQAFNKLWAMIKDGKGITEETKKEFELFGIANGFLSKEAAKATEKLTEEELTIQKLAKEYFNLDLQGKTNILSYKDKVKVVQDVIQEYDDEIDKLKQLQIEYGSNEQAVYGVNQATQDLINSKKEQIIQEQEVTLATIDVTKALDGSKESQILLNDAVIEGVKAAADFVTELAKGEKQTEAYGKALAANVMDVLKKMPEAIGDFADAFKETLPNLFQSLDEFQGKIKPFDKQSIKDYKEELKDLDVPKSLRDLYISSAKVWQDKDEIIKEGEALFAGMAGSLVHNFEEIDVKDVTTFLDEIGGRLTEMEAQGVGTAFTGNIRTLIDHIKNSSDPVQELLEHFDALKGAMDPAAIDVVSTSVKVFGTNMSDIISKSLLGDLTKETNAFQQAINKLGQEDLAKLATDVGAYMTGIRGEITGPNPQTEFTPERLKEIEDARQAEKAITIAQNKLKAQPTELTTAWQNAATAIDTATAQISLSVGTMADTVGTGILANVTSVAGLGTIWQQTSTNIGTYAPAITEATNTMSTTSVTAFNNSSVALGAYDKAFGILKTDVDTNTKAMTTATDTWSTGSITSFNNTSVALGAFDKAMKILEETVKTSTDNMLTETKEWETEMVKSFKAVTTGADEATTAVGKLYDAVDKLEDKTITVTMKVEEKGGSTGNNQSGGVELLTGTKLFTGGEGRKPEIHFFFPLDEMAQSHAKSEFTLPFSIADLGLSRASPATLMGKPSNQPTIPANLVSNLRLNANLHIDLGNEIKKIVREEINAIAVTRLDRMAF
jgi:hypothetical protein